MTGLADRWPMTGRAPLPRPLPAGTGRRNCRPPEPKFTTFFMPVSWTGIEIRRGIRLPAARWRQSGPHLILRGHRPAHAARSAECAGRGALLPRALALALALGVVPM